MASAQVFYDGPCPPAKPMDFFDFSAYQGTWYEIARYPNAAEEGTRGKCTTAQYFVYGDKGRVRNTHVVAGVKSYIDGDITHVEPGKVMLTYTFGGRSKNSFLTVLQTDYTNYSIGYGCKYFKDTDTHQVFSWIKSRSKVLDPNSLAIVNNYLQYSPLLDSDKYILNDYSAASCSYNFVKDIQEFLD
ncbi:unnamed protein product, partial [Iphiclides podalirius]